MNDRETHRYDRFGRVQMFGQTKATDFAAGSKATEEIGGRHDSAEAKGMNTLIDTVIIYWSRADDSFIVEVPELPGCMADGATYEEAVANAQVVIQEWLDTARVEARPIPEPRGKLAYA